MSSRVAICAVAQVKNEPNIWYQRFQGMLLDCLEPILQQTGVTYDMDKGIRNIVTCSDDVFDARTISDCGMGDVVGAQYRGEEKAAQDGPDLGDAAPPLGAQARKVLDRSRPEQRDQSGDDGGDSGDDL